MTSIIKDKAVCFTGHRIIAGEELHALHARLYQAVLSLVGEGYDTFISGGAMGFDMEAAECVLSIKERCPDIHLHLFLPCRDQTSRWENTALLARYKTILGMADSVRYVSDFYTDGCMFERNRQMVDVSSVCVSYMRHSRSGGTGYTVRYAAKKGLRIINIAEGEIKS